MGRQDPDPVLPRVGGDRRRAQLEPPPCGTIGLADDHELVRHVGDAGEQRDPEGPRAKERDPSDVRHLDAGGRLFLDSSGVSLTRTSSSSDSRWSM